MSENNEPRIEGWSPDEATGWVPIHSLKGWDRNPNTHPPGQIAQLAAQFRRFGYVDAITIAHILDEDVLEVRAGHGRIEALQAVLSEKPDFKPSEEAPGPGYIRATIKRFPTRLAADGYGLANNRLQELSEPDDDLVATILRDMNQQGVALDGLGWDDGELTALLGDAPTLEQDGDGTDGADDVGVEGDALPEKVPAITKPGEVITLGRHTLHCASCIDVANAHPPDSFDALLGDAPYGLSPDGRARTWDEIAALRAEGKGPKAGFMGKEWDAGVPGREWADAMFRVLKPGGHLVMFCGTRTDHRMICALEDAGFEVRDKIVWLHYQGFPKSLDVSKAIDKAAGAEREVVGQQTKARSTAGSSALPTLGQGEVAYKTWDVTVPATQEARRWDGWGDGWGTGLKPAIEPAVLCRKPLGEPTVAANVIKWGTGALNIDGCRYAEGDNAWPGPNEGDGGWGGAVGFQGAARQVPGGHGEARPSDGRFPANVYHCPKPARGERERGLEDAQQQASGVGALRDSGRGKVAANFHPTVKPLRLMRWLARLITPPGGTLFLPFGGSGTDLLAAHLEGFTSVATELEPAYCDIIRARVEGWMAKEG